MNVCEAYADRRIFIVYRLEQKVDGSVDKIPTHPVSRITIDAQDSSNWMLPELAQAWAKHLGPQYGVGVVIVEGSGMGCIDLDKHLLDIVNPDGTRTPQWSEHATKMCELFAGAGVELSQSARGLHIFFTYTGPLREHRVKNKQMSMECYTRKRFIALTGTMTSGDPRKDCTQQLHQVIADYYPIAPVSVDEEWTESERAFWLGPLDDTKLIEYALNQKSGRTMFGHSAPFSDLWTNNVEMLAQYYPPVGAGKPYNQSDADLSLANHLAYFTGANCQRMHGLMLRSQLSREKWYTNTGYLRRTIMKAASECKTVLRAPHLLPKAVTPTQAPAGVTQSREPPAASIVDRPPPGAILLVDQQIELFAGCTYIQDIHAILTPDGVTLTQERFDAEYNGYQFQMTIDGQRPARKAWEAFLFNEVHHFPKANGLLFDPRLPSHARVHRDGMDFINSWKPIYIHKVQGDPSPFVNHVRALYPLDADILLAYFAAIVQYPGVKFQWCPLLQGVEGNGKTFFSWALEHCVGARYTHHAKASELDSRFNSVLYGKLLVTVEDVKISENKQSVWEALKPMITNSRIEIEGKGVDKVTRDVCFNFILNSNHKDAIRKTANDRRIAVMFGAQQHMADLERTGLTKDYFVSLYKWARTGGWAIIADYLTRYPIPDRLNPASECVRAPDTSSTKDAIVASRGTVEQELQESIEEGRPGFRGGWISSHAVDQLLREMRKHHHVSPTKRREIIESLGYVLHPGVTDGRINIQPGNQRPRVYVTPTHPHISAQGTTLVTKLYQDAQLAGT